MTILIVIGILVFLIIVHELGHFFAAKIFRVKVEEFGIGYPPRAFTFGKWGGTEYTLNWLPFGGFVRLFGDIGEGNTGEGTFVSKNRGIQAAILFAGVLMNMIAAWLLFAGALYIGTPRIVETREAGVPTELLVAEVVSLSPAAVAGLQPGDTLLSVKSGGVSAELTPEAVTNFIRARGGQSIEISYERAEETKTVVVHPAHAVIPNAAEKPAIGVSLVMITSAPLSLIDSIKGGFVSTKNAFETVAGGLWGIVKDVARGAPALESIVGPVGLVGVVGSAAENGFGQILTLAAFISINLFIINLLPIPALDGGRLFVLGIEAVMRRNAPQVVTRLANVLGIGFLLTVMVLVTWNDIARLLT